MQKFHKGDLVRVAKDLGPHMAHFDADCDAIVIGSYADQYGRSTDTHYDEAPTISYTLHLKGKGRSSWYDEHQLTLIEKNRLDLLQEWKQEEERERKQHSDLDWIFANGPAILKSAPSASVEALAGCLGFSADDLWGPQGEMYVYYRRAMLILTAAEPYLKRNDKAGWVAWASKHQFTRGAA